MSHLTFHWFLPTNGGDGRHVVGGGHGLHAGPSGRPPSVSYLGQIARAAEDVGFEAALTPTGAWCDDAWLSTAMLSQVSERLRFLVAFRPGLTSPFLAAQMAGTFQNLTGGRLLLNVVTGGESHEQRMYGDFEDKDARYARCDEFLTVVRALWRGETVDFAGKHLRVEGARLGQVPDPVPAIYFGGSSPAAGEVAARHADVYLTWGEPPDAVREKVEWIRTLAADEGREVRFGLRMHTITRDTSAEAWAEAARLLAGMPADAIRRVQDGLGRSESEGQRRMLALNGGSKDDLEIHPNVWAGVGLVRGGAGTAFVGSHEEVADRIEEYADLGIDEFVLSGYPHLEGAYWFGEGVLPILAERGRWHHPAPAHPGTPAVPFAAAGAAS
jgi:alkanesulfonate monooxygenase